MKTLFRKKTIEKIKDTREEIKQGRGFGFKHSEETKQKMREAKSKAGGIRTFDLEEVLSQAKGDMEKSCEVYAVGLSGRRIQIYAVDWDERWIIDYSEFEDDLFARVEKMLVWPQTKWVGVRTIERGNESPQQLTSILKVGDGYKLKGDYEIALAKRKGELDLVDKEIGKAIEVPNHPE